jgi:hypothetical protein
MEDKKRHIAKTDVKKIFETLRINECLIMYDELLTEFKEVLDRKLDTKPFNDTLDEVPEAATTIRIISGIIEQAQARVFKTIDEDNECPGYPYMYRLGVGNKMPMKHD